MPVCGTEQGLWTENTVICSPERLSAVLMAGYNMTVWKLT